MTYSEVDLYIHQKPPTVQEQAAYRVIGALTEYDVFNDWWIKVGANVRDEAFDEIICAICEESDEF